jgi:hypothetical protein
MKKGREILVAFWTEVRKDDVDCTPARGRFSEGLDWSVIDTMELLGRFGTRF